MSAAGLDAVRDALADVKKEGGFEPRRVALAPVAVLPPTAAEAPPAKPAVAVPPPEQATGPVAPADNGEAAGEEEGRVPGTAKGARRMVNVNLPASTRERLDAARGEPPVRTRADVVLDALAATFDAIAEERRAELESPKARFGAPRIRRRRLALDDPRDIPIQFAPEEATDIKAAADEVGLTVSALVTEALDRHLQTD